MGVERMRRMVGQLFCRTGRAQRQQRSKGERPMETVPDSKAEGTADNTAACGGKGGCTPVIPGPRGTSQMKAGPALPWKDPAKGSAQFWRQAVLVLDV